MANNVSKCLHDAPSHLIKRQCWKTLLMTVSYASVHLLMSCQKRLCKALQDRAGMWESGKELPCCDPCLSNREPGLGAVNEQAGESAQAKAGWRQFTGPLSQIHGMMDDSKTLNSSFSLNNLGIYWFPLSIPVSFLSPCILFSFGVFSCRQGMGRGKNSSVIWFRHPHMQDRCHYVVS